MDQLGKYASVLPTGGMFGAGGEAADSGSGAEASVPGSVADDGSSRRLYEEAGSGSGEAGSGGDGAEPDCPCASISCFVAKLAKMAAPLQYLIDQGKGVVQFCTMEVRKAAVATLCPHAAYM